MTLPHQAQRPRRLRSTAIIRDAVAQTRLRGEQLIQPHFCLPRESGSEPIESMPGIYRHGTKEMLMQIAKDLSLGINKILLFGLTTDQMKDGHGSQSGDKDSAVTKAVSAIKAEFGDEVLLMSANPGRIIERYPITIERPRSISTMNSGDFTRIRSEIWDKLAVEVDRSMAGQQ